MTKAANASAIKMRKTYVRKLATGIQLEAEVSPCVFMYPGYPLQVQVTLKLKSGDSAGSAIVVDHTLNAKTATQADVKRLLASVRVAPCTRCTTPAFDPSTVETNRNGLCETCFMSVLDAKWAKEQEAELRRIAKRDSRMKAKGMKCRVAAWIHPDDGDDYQVDWYCPKKPTSADVQRRLRKLGSVILDDWQLVSL
jgi:hypothetical protein